MKTFLLIISLVALETTGSSVREQWHSFKRQYGKSYMNQYEEQYRLSIFTKTQKMIDEHNAKYDAGFVSYRMKMNKFGDMLPEVSAKLNGFNKTGRLVSHKLAELSYLQPANIPESIDWRQKGAVTPVKDQGELGSCWAFSITGTMEGQLFRKTGNLLPLSEQQLVDCSGKHGDGCDGIVDGYQYIKEAGGLASESLYPHDPDDGSCKYNRSMAVPGTALKSYVNLPKGDENALKAAVAIFGPISIAVSAGNRGFMLYESGIFSGDTCDSSVLDHAVLVVGYGAENGQDYWIIKNSWGPLWGEDGYIRIARNHRNVCGVATLASYPVL